MGVCGVAVQLVTLAACTAAVDGTYGKYHHGSFFKKGGFYPRTMSTYGSKHHKFGIRGKLNDPYSFDRKSSYWQHGNYPRFSGSKNGYGRKYPDFINQKPSYGGTYPSYIGQKPSYGGTSYIGQKPNHGGKFPDTKARMPAFGSKYPLTGGKYPGIHDKYPVKPLAQPVFEKKPTISKTPANKILEQYCFDHKGQTVSPGSRFFDGCNTCMCGKFGMPTDCTLKYCGVQNTAPPIPTAGPVFPHHQATVRPFQHATVQPFQHATALPFQQAVFK